MFDQLFEGFRKASESSTLAQQEMLKQWIQQWPSASLSAAGTAIERSSAFQKRWIESASETLLRQRELLDSTCRAGITLVERTAHASDAKSPDDYRRLAEELWQKLFEVLKDQSDSQFQELKKASQGWLELAQTR